MITIEMKIDLFEKMIEERHLVERRQHLEQLKIQYAQLLDDMAVKYEAQRREKLVHLERKVTLEMSQLEAREKVSIQRQIRENEAWLVRRLVEAVKAEWKERIKSERYKAAFLMHFERLTADISSKIQSVWVSPMDFQLIPVRYNPVVSEEIIGGFIIRCEGNQQVDYTINRQLEEMSLKLGCMIDHLISDGGACHEQK